ncbi:DNA-3-methyladenine glycosylase-like [Eriocheir sinensis]|uniref:DNA-3-methyladenine glycosylase-like n=1 Tax=Eriocheir sinensis TaxID=95602 RepID=UPI0021C8BA15|nr:DNA-3-methyladenine glycosylase-like [Eriocheir sinensis]
MSRKRSKPQTDNDINGAKLARGSPTPVLVTSSPYFSRGEVAGGSHGEERRAGTLRSRFFDQECVELARALLGKVLVRVVEGQRVSARVVETEGYLGGPDAASHSSGGKRTPRNEPMYMKPGTAYVYSIYGMYHCFNVSSRGDGACVLVRAAEPLEGLEVMVEGRGKRRGASAPPLKPHQLCNGPSKLCQALALTKDSANKLDLSVSEEFWVEEEEEELKKEEAEEGCDGGRGGGAAQDKIVVSARIGVDSYGEEWAKKPLRFYILGNKCVSVRDKEVEKGMLG